MEDKKYYEQIEKQRKNNIFSVPFVRNKICLRYAKEIRLKVEKEPTESTYNRLQKIHELFPDQRLALIFKDEYNSDITKQLEKLPFKNQLILYSQNQNELIDTSIPQIYPRYFYESAEIATTDLPAQCHIYIYGTLLHELKDIYNWSQKNNHPLRMIINQDIDSFIFPNALEFYEPFFDIIEFDTSDFTYKNIDTLFKIYTKNDRWMGNINSLAPKLEEYKNINSMILPAQFLTKHKINCRKRCLYSNCRTCYFNNTKGV